MILKIKVTKDILRKAMWCGTGNNQAVSTSCAIALAIRDIFPDAQVSRHITTWTCKNDIVYIPQSAKDFIQDFDNSTPEERLLLPEFEFEVELSNDIINSINISDIHKSATLEVVS